MRSKCNLHRVTIPTYLEDSTPMSTRNWVISRGIWYLDDCLMFVSAWNPSETISLPEIKTILIWLTLKNIPFQPYSTEGFGWIASGIGEPMLTSTPWLDPTSIGEAKILVEVKLDRLFPKRVALQDKEGTISLVDIVYSWLPSSCTTCGQLGHKANHFLGVKSTKVATNAPKNTQVIVSEVLATSKEVDAASTHSALLQNTASMSKVHLRLHLRPIPTNWRTSHLLNLTFIQLLLLQTLRHQLRLLLSLLLVMNKT
ncbi:unnamed protein product [Brassica oleracea]